MGTDLPLTTPLMGAIVRGFRKRFILIRSHLHQRGATASDLRAGGESTRVGDAKSTGRNDGVGNTTDDVGRLRRCPYKSRRTMGRTGVVRLNWRRATTSKPADSNIDNVP
jgi:hypothetical protein